MPVKRDALSTISALVAAPPALAPPTSGPRPAVATPNYEHCSLPAALPVTHIVHPVNPSQRWEHAGKAWCTLWCREEVLLGHRPSCPPSQRRGGDMRAVSSSQMREETRGTRARALQLVLRLGLDGQAQWSVADWARRVAGKCTRNQAVSSGSPQPSPAPAARRRNYGFGSAYHKGQVPLLQK